MKKLQTESADWIKYRSAYPSRRNSGRLNFTRSPKPGKPDQRAWHVHEHRNEHQCQQWVLVPTLNPVSQLTEPLAGAPSEANLFAYKPPLQGWHEHWTNIHGMWYLVEKHPQIETVRQHKKTKALDPKRFDSYGREAKFHQAPFDLAIGLAASGAEIYKEDTEKHRGGLIALWWSGPAAPNISAVAEAVFFDICELGEKIPNCAFGRAMSASLTSTPAASASGGQAASSSGPPPTSATPPSESQPTAAEPQPLEGETSENLDATEAEPPGTRSILEGPHPEAKATSSGPSPQPLAGITEGEAGAKEESHSLPLPAARAAAAESRGNGAS